MPIDRGDRAGWEARVASVSTELGRRFWLSQVGPRIAAGQVKPTGEAAIQRVIVLETQGDYASVRAAYTLQGQPASIDLQLKQENGQWKFNGLALITPAGKGG